MRPVSPEDVEARSQSRARHNQRRIYVMGAFAFASLLLFAALLQRQQSTLGDLLEQQASTVRLMCVQRQANVIKANSNWDALTEIERNNKFIDDELRAKRLAVFANGKLIVPDCTF
jgi:hypothetical protein